MMHERLAEAVDKRQRVIAEVTAMLRAQRRVRQWTDAEIYDWVWRNNIWEVEDAKALIRSQQ